MKNTGDIEFVRQDIGHVNVVSTSSYVENLSDDERKNRIQNINDAKQLIIQNDLPDDNYSDNE